MNWNSLSWTNQVVYTYIIIYVSIWILVRYLYNYNAMYIGSVYMQYVKSVFDWNFIDIEDNI